MKHLQEEFEAELRQQEWLDYMGFEIQHIPELKVRGEDRKGGIDWYIYRERILKPLLFPFATAAKTLQPDLIINGR